MTASDDATSAVTELYRGHALGLTRLALMLVGDRGTAEDVVQEAFAGLYKRWPRLRERDKALTYVRSAVLNGKAVSENEERLTDALKSVGETVEPGDVLPPPFPDTPRRTSPHPLAMAAVIAASVVMVGGAAAGGYVAFDRTTGDHAGPNAAASNGRQVSVFLCVVTSSKRRCAKQNATDQQKQDIKRRLEQMPQVRSVEYESQLEAYKRIKKQFTGHKDFLASTRATDVPDSFRAQVADLQGARAVTLVMETLPGVDTVTIDPRPPRA
ncbi:permease-like cell division protein FtsX [Actinomadura meridiana]